MIQALLLEDDPHLSKVLVQILRSEGFELRLTRSIFEVEQVLLQEDFCLAVVDLMLAEENGMDFVRFARERCPDLGIIIVSSKSSPLDRIVGIEVGADDYITKPLEPRELIAHARRLVNRIEQAGTQSSRAGRVYHFADFVLDRERRELVHAETGVVDLTGKELDLLLCLVERPGKPVSRDKIAKIIHGRDFIKTLRGTGYAFSEIVRVKEQTAAS
ncbi:MAG: response regulator transcription factor [Candidatus Protistobacter heckmanni]|nr:response regulator transcription factor [Candidatus Protistobacter heckmanni]